MKQDDVADPLHPKATGSVRIGGIVARSPHPSSAESLNGGPQMVEVSRDGRRIYFTNSLYGSWDRQFYPDGIKGWMVKLRSEEHTSELQSLMRISYAVFCLKKKIIMQLRNTVL